LTYLIDIFGIKVRQEQTCGLKKSDYSPCIEKRDAV
jgi:hypothetical protein